ncbi:MAG: PBP1A family penicillin-binding protein [Armatimonadota bacterium]
MVNQVKVNKGRLRSGKQPSKLRKIVTQLQAGVLLAFCIGIGVVIGLFVSISRELPKVSGYSPHEASKIYSSDNVLLATFGEENREFVELNKIPKDLINATVAIEDRRFYEHSGVDLRGIGRAIVKNIRGGRMAEGGSTITQQLARNVYLSPKKTLNRKLREAVLAVVIERNYTKSKIIELYLNQVYYGSSAYGVEAASKIYFGKNVSNLKLSESALLAGLPQRPSSYSPHVDLEAAVNRRDIVLNRMEELKYITHEECEEAKARTPRIMPMKPTKYRSKAPYFTDYVKKYLREHNQFGDDLIERGGLRIYTTLNYKMQVAAQRALTDGIRSARRRGQMDDISGNGALVCIEPSTGYIRAMVGGEDYARNEFNRAVQAERQPGSSFKAFVYTAAVDKLGWDANHRLPGGHFTYISDIGTRWSPKNYDGRYPSNLTVRQAVARSVNVAAVQAALQVGLKNVIDYAHRLGIKSEIEPYPALAIGGIKGIRVLEMTSAYGVFATGGYYAEPSPIAKIVDSRGQLYDEQTIERRRVLGDRTAKVMDELFRGVVTSGTGRTVNSIAGARGKTGTTNDGRDVWFIGYVPNKLVTAVWAGNDNNRPMRHVSGSGVCGPIWKEFMGTALRIHNDNHRPHTTTTEKPAADTGTVERSRPTQDNTPTETNTGDENNQPEEPALGTVRVTICNETALLATSACPSTHTEVFVEGNQPTSYCTVHRPKGSSSGSTGSGTQQEGSDRGLRMTPPPPMSPDR